MESPVALAVKLRRCVLCGKRPIVVVGVFLPTTEAMRDAVLRLRMYPVNGTQGLAYGLCRRHPLGEVTAQTIEDLIMHAAEQVTVQ